VLVLVSKTRTVTMSPTWKSAGSHGRDRVATASAISVLGSRRSALRPLRLPLGLLGRLVGVDGPVRSGVRPVLVAAGAAVGVVAGEEGLAAGEPAVLQLVGLLLRRFSLRLGLAGCFLCVHGWFSS
jgi:hypothetical protein